MNAINDNKLTSALMYFSLLKTRLSEGLVYLMASPGTRFISSRLVKIIKYSVLLMVMIIFVSINLYVHNTLSAKISSNLDLETIRLNIFSSCPNRLKITQDGIVFFKFIAIRPKTRQGSRSLLRKTPGKRWIVCSLEGFLHALLSWGCGRG